MIADLAELVGMYEQGVWTRGELLYQITLFVPEVSVQAVVDQLPEELRENFVQWLRATYDNQIPADDFVSINTSEDREHSRARIQALRAWLRTTPT